MATYYIKKISGLVYRSTVGWPTVADTSSATLNATINVLGGNNHELVVYPDTFLEAIEPTVNSIIIRSASLFELPEGVDNPTITIGPPPSSNYVCKINGARTAIHFKGAFRFIGFSDFNFGTVSFQNNCNDIKLSKLGDYRPFVSSSDNASDFALYIFGTGSTQPSNIMVDGVDIEVNHLASSAIRISLCKTGENNTITGCSLKSKNPILSGKGKGLELLDCESWHISDNIIGDGTVWSTGVLLTNSSLNNIEYNTITDCWNGLAYPDGLGYGVLLNFSSSGNTISRNRIHRCNRGIGCGSTLGTGNNVISFNEVVDSQVNGIDHTSSVDYYNYIVNNIIIHRPIGVAGHGIVNQQAGKKVAIKNNIVTSYTQTTRPHNIQCISIDDTPPTSIYNIDIDNNLYLATGTAYLGGLDTINYTTFSEWKAALNANALITSKDANSKNEDPMFVDLAAGDYHLRPTSPCIGTGTKISGVTTDFEGNPLFPPYNIGPFGLAADALGVAPVANDGPPRNNITRLTGTSATINPTDTYEFSDTNAWRVVTGWTAGTANDFFDANGVPITFTGQQLIDSGIGYQLYHGQKGVAGYEIEQDAKSHKKIVKVLRVNTYLDSILYDPNQDYNW